MKVTAYLVHLRPPKRDAVSKSIRRKRVKNAVCVYGRVCTEGAMCRCQQPTPVEEEEKRMLREYQEAMEEVYGDFYY